jgi:ABC-2 type transport system permease protein
MNYTMVNRLILKDWFFLRGAIFAYFVTGLLAIGLTAMGTDASSYAGSILLITVMIAIGFHLVMVTVVQERSEHTLPFIMSLPISPMEYTTAKIAANLLIFLIPWVTLTTGAMLLLGSEGARSGALIPFTLIILTELLVAYTLVLTVAIVTESQGWTIGVLVVTNLFFQGFLYWVSHMPAVATGMKGHGAVWDQTAVTLLAAEVGIAIFLIFMAFVLQARKKEFL